MAFVETLSKVGQDLFQLTPLSEVFQKIQGSRRFEALTLAMRLAFREELTSESAIDEQKARGASSIERLNQVKQCLRVITQKISNAFPMQILRFCLRSANRY